MEKKCMIQPVSVRKLVLFVLWAFCALSLRAAHQPEFSAAGFFELPNTGRQAYSMNPAWRFHKGAVTGAERVDFDDSEWALVSLPDGTELLPSEASGCVNYQGEVWYRKHFTPEDAWKGKKMFLHFEAIMGLSLIHI